MSYPCCVMRTSKGTRSGARRSAIAPRTSGAGIAAAAAWLAGAALVALALAGCNRSKRAPQTAVSGRNGYAYVTNNGDGTVSEFSRLEDGGLMFQRLVRAGTVDGPTGIAVDPSNRFVYVANEGDNRVYQFHIRRRNGNLVPIGKGSVSDGAGSRPQQIAIAPQGGFAYITNAGTGKGGEGSISQYTIDPNSGALTPLAVFRGSGLEQPFGIVAAPNGKFVYVSDRTAGAMLAFAVEPSGTLKLAGSTPSLGAKPGQPQLVTIDSSGGFVYAADAPKGLVAAFKTSGGGKLDFIGTSDVGTSTAEPFATALARSGASEFAYTGNRSVDTVSYFVVKDGALTLVGQSPTGLGGPSGMIADPSGRFLYVVNRDAATVAQFTILGARSGALSLTETIFNEDPANESSHPLYIALTR